ncbi:MAG: hypothetical protein AAF799_37220 [Myxococcota bacterium]
MSKDDIMNIRSIAISTSFGLAAFTLIGSACDVSDDGSEPGNDGLRHIYFDAAEVNEALADNPNTSFLVDLSEGNVVHFDQQDEDFDFSAFTAKCPSMPAPVPFTQMIDNLDLQIEGEEEWSMQSDLTDQTRFRYIGGCWTERSCNSAGTDCVITMIGDC